MITRIFYLVAVLLGGIMQLNAQVTLMNLHLKEAPPYNILNFAVDDIDSITFSITKPGSGVTYNGYKYATIVLNNGQEWMTENLKTTSYNDGTPIPLVSDPTEWTTLNTPGYCWYNNAEASNRNIYGGLYNWYTVNTEKLCPAGWHVPTKNDFEKLISFVGGADIAGRKLKEMGTEHWLNPNYADDEIGFSGRPGGVRDEKDGSFEFLGDYALFWSSTTSKTEEALYLSFGRGTGDKTTLPSVKMRTGHSVRCLKD